MSSLPDPITVTYSTVNNLEIKVDIYVTENVRTVLPGIVIFHGGGLTVGSRHISPYTAITAKWLFGEIRGLVSVF